MHSFTKIALIAPLASLAQAGDHIHARFCPEKPDHSIKDFVANAIYDENSVNGKIRGTNKTWLSREEFEAGNFEEALDFSFDELNIYKYGEREDRPYTIQLSGQEIFSAFQEMYKEDELSNAEEGAIQEFSSLLPEGADRLDRDTYVATDIEGTTADSRQKTFDAICALRDICHTEQQISMSDYVDYAVFVAEYDVMRYMATDGAYYNYEDSLKLYPDSTTIDYLDRTYLSSFYGSINNKARELVAIGRSTQMNRDQYSRLQTIYSFDPNNRMFSKSFDELDERDNNLLLRQKLDFESRQLPEVEYQVYPSTRIVDELWADLDVDDYRVRAGSLRDALADRADSLGIDHDLDEYFEELTSRSPSDPKHISSMDDYLSRSEISDLLFYLKGHSGYSYFTYKDLNSSYYTNLGLYHDELLTQEALEAYAQSADTDVTEEDWYKLFETTLGYKGEPVDGTDIFLCAMYCTE